MPDDIVTRLRTYYNASLVTSELLPEEIEEMKKAAEEIERMQTECSLWKMTAEHLARQLGKVEYADVAYQDIADSIKRR